MIIIAWPLLVICTIGLIKLKKTGNRIARCTAHYLASMGETQLAQMY